MQGDAQKYIFAAAQREGLNPFHMNPQEIDSEPEDGSGRNWIYSLEKKKWILFDP